MSSTAYFLAIDNGTQSVRALLFDRQGNLLAKARQELTPYVSPNPGWAEQEPSYYWASLGQACRQLFRKMAEQGISAEQVAGVSVTTQRGTVVNVDDQGVPLRPAIVWLDQRKAEVHTPLPWRWRTLFRIVGVDDIVTRFREKAQASWIAQNQPELWARTHKYLLLSGYLNYQLTGEFKDAVASQVGYLPFDFKRQKWAPAHDWRYLAMPGLRPEMLPELVQTGQQLGQVTAEAAQHTGIPVGTPVFASASDKACEILGSGGTEPSVACMSYGTTATINTINKKYVEPIPFMPAYPAAVPGLYSSEIMIYRGFWLVSWFKQQFGLYEERAAEQKGLAPEQLFDELIEQVPPGSMGLMLQPYWNPGARDPGPEAKGAIIGFGDVHTRAHVYRAIIEGLAYGLREGKEKLAKRNGVSITKLRVAGGGSQSDRILQLTADIFGLTVERPHTYETSGLGASIAIAVGLGEYPDFTTACAAMTRVGRVFEPNLEAHAIYDQLYQQVYLKMYKQLKPLYAAIQNITGYPE